MSISDTEIRRLEEIGARTWPARKTLRLDGWLVSMDRGVTRRANSTLPIAWDGMRDPDRPITEVERLYQDRGLTPCFKMTRAALPTELDALLDRRGYRSEGRSLVLTHASPAGAGLHGPEVETSSVATPDWLACGWPGHTDDESWIDIVRRIPDPKAFALVRLDGEPAGTALASADDGWTCITAVHTQPAFRRRGVARALVAALAHWARPLGPGIFLQVESENEAALRLYASAGFRPAYGYHYRTLTP